MKLTKKLIMTLVITALSSSLTWARDSAQGSAFLDLPAKIQGHQFCNIDGSNSGWGFTKDGQAHYFAPKLGMPNPNEYYEVEYLRPRNQFVVVPHAINDTVIGPALFFFYNTADDTLLVGDQVLSVSACAWL
jgi:hypothetical protein